MAIQKNKKRKLAKLEELKPQINNVVPITINSAVLSYGKNERKAHFKRLCYKFCPPLVRGSGVKSGSTPDNSINMNREGFALEMYNHFKELSLTSMTGHSRFTFLTLYVRTLDEHDRNVDLSESNVLWFCSYIETQYLSGALKKTYYIHRNSGMRTLLKICGKDELSRKVPTIKKQRKGINRTTSLSDNNLSRVGKKLMTAYKAYSSCILKGTIPKRCFLVTEDDLVGLPEVDRKKLINSLKTAVKTRSATINQTVRIAFMITSMWTGANLGALATLKKSDVSFRKSDGDTYEFHSVKARALYQKQKLGFGFTRLTKEFIESWLLVSQKIASANDSPLFPFVDRECNVNLKSIYNTCPQKQINSILSSIKFPTINTTVFRKTRSSVLMRAFEDIFVVAEGNNHSLETAANNYLNGNIETHEMKLASAFHAQKKMSEGSPKKESVAEAIYKFKDPLTNDEWKKKAKTTAGKTPTGMRCTEPFGDRAKKSLRALRSLGIHESDACVDFLGCFECENHALIAEKDDIWLMLSFKDSVVESLSRPSFNSVPTDHLYKVLNTVNAILDRYRSIASSEFHLANELNKESPHPLYDDESSISDLLEVYK